MIRKGNRYQVACCRWGATGGDYQAGVLCCEDHRAQLLDFLDWLKNPARRV